MNFKFKDKCKCYEGLFTTAYNKDLFFQDTIDVKVFFYSEKERNVEREYELIENIKNNFSNMYNNILEELFSFKTKYNMEFEARDENGYYHVVNIDKKEDLHKYIAPIDEIQLLFYEDNIYTSFNFYSKCIISEDGISAIFLNEELLSLDCTDSETNFHNNIVYKLKQNS